MRDLWESIAPVVARCAEAASLDPDLLDEVTAEEFGGLRRAQRDALALKQLRVEVRSRLRSTTLEAERRAEHVERETNRERFGVPKVRHGSTAKADGAAVRGCDCESCIQALEIEERHQSQLTADLSGIVNRFIEASRIEWTEELLALTFARSDGTLVRWGDASKADHEQRVEMFLGNAEANIEGAARHAQAIADLEASGAPCLGELFARAD